MLYKFDVAQVGISSNYWLYFDKTDIFEIDKRHVDKGNFVMVHDTKKISVPKKTAFNSQYSNLYFGFLIPTLDCRNFFDAL
jgi:hypothetical protein